MHLISSSSILDAERILSVGGRTCPIRLSKTSRSALISGASIAGPTLAYWLERYGFDVTVVERAASVRSGGYPIDVRGTAMKVVERMGLRSQVEAAHIATRDLTFVDAMGKTIGSVPIYDLTVNEAGQDVELPRGELTNQLYGLTKDSAVRYRFKDLIEALEDDGAGVDVRFTSGERQRYDVVIGADGIHSNTRRLAFGPEEPFSHYLGSTFNIFSMPNDLGLSHGAIVYAEAGRAAGALAVRDSPELFVFMVFGTARPPFGAHPDKAEQIRRTSCGVRRWRLGSPTPAGRAEARRRSLFRHREPDPHAILVGGARFAGRRRRLRAILPIWPRHELGACRRLCSCWRTGRPR